MSLCEVDDKIILTVSDSQLVGRDPKEGHNPILSGSQAFVWKKESHDKVLALILKGSF